MNTTPSRRTDEGFTLVEIVVVVVILGIVAAVVAFSVRGVANRGEATACDADARTLVTAADVYMIKEQAAVVPEMGASANRYELFLVDAGFLVQVSTKYDLAADGTVTTTGAPCP